MSTEGLAEWLLGCIAEDEQVAWEAADDGYGAIDWAGESGPTDVHIARHDPAHVLAVCDAHRRIVELADDASTDRGTVILEFCVGSAEIEEAWATDPGALILKALATAYADRPGFREEWRA